VCVCVCVCVHKCVCWVQQRQAKSQEGFVGRKGRQIACGIQGYAMFMSVALHLHFMLKEVCVNIRIGERGMLLRPEVPPSTFT
jgi:hypothetical protein